ncbi:FtsZ-binding cell division protein ZapB [Microbacterium halimionae]|uniref:FtsZ-binding cell division protein ZapB n=1 Tax=Microbacterium halimionae TaxID=1526413 RepID=A0A7W3JNN9_9MICO|nr:PAC2 family protein [Microbacterium halimionae]MBA8816063.1 FtsZ-binding cell division protein ZapB [Microbacterium halimionae]NII96265.1 FtsZ-binding cell division protein ZapB [Microbacterium halimionae]
MSFSASLFESPEPSPHVPQGLPLVIALTGFTDAGGTVSQLVDYLRGELGHEVIASYRNDVLLDYRARRPLISFDADHLTAYIPPRLELSTAHDALGQPFLLLAGYEPDFGWEAFVQSVLSFAERYAVSHVTWVHAIPMPVPHTRPLGTTVSGTRKELTEAHSVWKPHTQIPATVGHLIEYRFAQQGDKIAGFALLVPHYLGDTEYPGATLAALDSITVATDLVFAVDELREENREYLEKVTEQVSGSEELTRMLENLEERHDAYMAGSTLGTPILHAGDLPSADELTAELERFLANRPGDDDTRNPLQ